MLEYESIEEARIAHPHTMIGGAYWCPDATLPHLGGGSGLRYAVRLQPEDFLYYCPTCGAVVRIATCGEEGE